MYDTLRHYWWEKPFELFFHKWCWVNLLLCSQSSISEVAGHGLSAEKIWIYFLFAQHSSKIVALIDFSSILYASLLTLTWWSFSSVQLLSCLTLCNPMNRSMPGLPVHHQLPKSIQTHVHWVGDAIQPSHPVSSPSPPALNLSQHQSLFKWVSSSHEVAKVLEFQLQHQSFQWTPRTDLL